MNTNLSRIFAVIFIVLGGVLFFVPDHIAPVCYYKYRRGVEKTMLNQIKQEQQTEKQAENQMPDCSSGVCTIPADNSQNDKMSEDKKMDGTMSADKNMENEAESVEGQLKKKRAMPCYNTGNAIKGVAIIMVLTGFAFFLLDNKDIRTGLAISNIAIGILPILFIKIIGVCKMATMSCRSLTTPAVYLISGVYIILNVFVIIRNRK